LPRILGTVFTGAGPDLKNGGTDKKLSNRKDRGEKYMENKFCFLKGIVECDSGTIQDCNNKRTVTCPLQNENAAVKDEKKKSIKQGFCYLKGLVDCSAGMVQDCNMKRVETCPKD